MNKKTLTLFMCSCLLIFVMSCKNKYTKLANNGLPLSNQWVIAAHFLDDEKIYYPSKSSYISIVENLTTFAGNGGCNRVGGKIVVEKQNKIRFYDIFATKMACDKLADEQKFLEGLTNATHYSISGAELTLYKEHKKIMLLESYRH